MDIEKALGMGSGYVLDFSNRTFADFVASSIGLDIYSGQYSSSGSSKANHLRCFFEKAPDHQIGQLLADLIKHARQSPIPCLWPPRPIAAPVRILDNATYVMEYCLMR